MALPDGFYVEAEIDWNDKHPDEYSTGKQLADALDGSEFSVLADEANDRHLLVTEREDE